MTASDTTGEKQGLSVRAPRQGRAHGPLGAQVWVHQKPEPLGEGTGIKAKGTKPGHTTLKFGSKHVGDDANALVVLRRLAFDKRGADPATDKRGKLPGYLPHTPLHTWAVESGAGQRKNDYLKAVLARRRVLLERLSAPRGGNDDEPGARVLRLLLVTEWRLVTGLGLQYGVLDSGLALHGTYGWPVVPASTLKGIAAVGARLKKVDEERIRQVLGDPRPGTSPAEEGPKGRGGVVFLDTLPQKHGVTVHGDTITPHQQPYYTDTFPGEDGSVEEDVEVGPEGGNQERRVRPPSEHHNPVPVPFLSVSGGLHVDLVGESAQDLTTVASWLREAGDEAGAGGRTSGGYGYFTCDEYENEEQR